MTIYGNYGNEEECRKIPGLFYNLNLECKKLGEIQETKKSLDEKIQEEDMN